MQQLQKIIRKKQLPDYTGLQRTALDDLIAAGRFPKPIRLSTRAIGWLESELADWQQARIAESRQAETK